MALPSPSADSAALVTGASSGIGQAIATELASAGHNLVLVARRRDRMESIADELRRCHGVDVTVAPTDLADPAERQRLLEMIVVTGTKLSALVLCAGFGMVGPYVDNDVDKLTTMVRTNVESTMILARGLAPLMVASRQGAILLVSSVAGNQPIPYFAAYAATKAAVTSLGESLHYELAPAGVSVSVLAPANVATEFADVAEAPSQSKRQPAFLTASAEQCAEAALDAMRSGKRKVTPLPQAAAVAWISAHMPRSLWYRFCRSMMT